MDCGIDAQNEAADLSEFKLEQDPAGATFQLKPSINDRNYSIGDNHVGSGGQIPGCHIMTQVGIPTRPRSHWNGLRLGERSYVQPAISAYSPLSLDLGVKLFTFWRGSSNRSQIGQSGCGDVSEASSLATPSAITTRALPSRASLVTGRFPALNRAVNSVMPHS